jgi:hypothetical protein
VSLALRQKTKHVDMISYKIRKECQNQSPKEMLQPQYCGTTDPKLVLIVAVNISELIYAYIIGENVAQQHILHLCLFIYYVPCEFEQEKSACL